MGFRKNLVESKYWEVQCRWCYTSDEIIMGDSAKDTWPKATDRSPIHTKGEAGKAFRARGWVLHEDGLNTCPMCNRIEESRRPRRTPAGSRVQRIEQPA